MKYGRALVTGALAVALVIVSLVIAAPASATSQEAGCFTYVSGAGDACLYYRINYGGSMVGVLDTSVADYESPWVTFRTAGDGHGLGVGNATGSYFNADLVCSLTVWEHHNYRGRWDTWQPQHGSGNAGFAVRNNNRSQRFCG